MRELQNPDIMGKYKDLIGERNPLVKSHIPDDETNRRVFRFQG